MMRDNPDNLLDGILQDWHAASRAEPLVPERTECVTFAHHATNRGADFEHEIAEESIDATRMQAIQFHIDQLSPLHRTALEFEARNLNARVKVWRSARLPEDKAAREAVIKAARDDLMRRLANDGRVL